MGGEAHPARRVVGAEVEGGRDAGGGELVSLQWCTCGHAPSVRLARLDKLAAHVEPAPPALTPSEVALAKVLAAWEAHRFCEDEGVSAARVIDRITDVLCECGMVDARGPGRRLDPDARALLDRARKAGVL